MWLLGERRKPGCYGDYLRAATRTQIATTQPGARRKGIFRGYGYQWWTDNELAPGFWGVGFAGQVLGLNPATDKIIIKFSYQSSWRASRRLYSLFADWNAAR